MHRQGAGGPRARSTLADELARAGVVDPNFRARRGLGMHGCWMKQGGWKQALPVGKGGRAVLPGGEARTRAVRRGRNRSGPPAPPFRRDCESVREVVVLR